MQLHAKRASLHKSSTLRRNHLAFRNTGNPPFFGKRFSCRGAILNNKIRHTLFPVLAAAIWGSAFVVQSRVADKIGAFTFNAMRSFIASVTLLIIIAVFAAFKKINKNQKLGQILLGGVVCGAALAIATFLQQSAMTEAGSGKAGFITALYIILVPIFEMLMGRKSTLKVWFAVALAATGLYFLCVKENFSIQPSDLLLLGCTVMFALHIIAVDKFVKNIDGIVLSFAQFAFVTLFSAIGAVLLEDISFAGITECFLSAMYVGVFSSGIAYTLQILAQKDADPTLVSLLMSLESVFSVVLGALILKEKMTQREYIGCVLMFCASTVAQLPERKKKQKTH